MEHVRLLRILVGSGASCDARRRLDAAAVGRCLAELFDSVGTGVEFAAGLTAAAFALIGVFSLLYGAAHTWAATLLLRRRTAFGRVLMLALALVDLLVLPFGTALGAYASGSS